MKESNFQLVGKPKLNKFQYKTNDEFCFGEEISIEMDTNIQVSRGIDENAQQALVLLTIGIFNNRDVKEAPFVIEIEVEGHFSWTDDFDKNNQLLESMLKQNAPAILYSYVRPLITLITVEANMPPLVIPLINFQE